MKQLQQRHINVRCTGPRESGVMTMPKLSRQDLAVRKRSSPTTGIYGYRLNLSPHVVFAEQHSVQILRTYMTCKSLA